MNLKNLLTAIATLIIFNLNAFSQEGQVEAPMFGANRGFKYAYSHDFKKISKKATSFQFKIKNDGKSALHIIDVDMPAKIGVTLLNKVVSPGKEAVIIATIDPKILPKGKVKEVITVTTKQSGAGIVTTKEMKFLVQAEIK